MHKFPGIPAGNFMKAYSREFGGLFCARRIVLLKLTTDRDEASRGLFVTAGLLNVIR